MPSNISRPTVLYIEVLIVHYVLVIAQRARVMMWKISGVLQMLVAAFTSSSFAMKFTAVCIMKGLMPP